MLNRLPEAEENLRAGAADVVEVVVGEDEVVVPGVVLVGVEVGEDGGDVARMRTARDAVDRVVGARKRYARRLVVLEVPVLLVAARLLHGRPVVDRVHQLDRAFLLGEIDRHERCRGGLRRHNDSGGKRRHAQCKSFHSLAI